MPKALSCPNCQKVYQTVRGLRKHFQNYSSHKEEANNKTPPLQAAAAAANFFLDVSAYHRSARLKELFKLLTREEFSTVVLYSITKHVSTSSFLLSRSMLAQGSVSESKLRGELEVLISMVAECYPDSLLYSLKQHPVSALFPHPYNKSVLQKCPTERKLVTQAKCREWVNFIDDLNMPQDKKEKANLVEFIVSHKDGEFFKNTIMPVIFKKNFNQFVLFASGLVSNFNIGYTKYQNIVRNQLGKELENVFGINIMVPKDDMCEKIKEQKETLQETLSLNFAEYNGVVAAYTNVKNTVEWLLSKESLKETILVPKEKLIVYHYIDAFPWMQWSKFFNGETAIRIKIVEPHNLLSSIVTVCSWLGPDDYNHVSTLGRETLQQLSDLRSVYHPLLRKNIEVIVRGVADGCQRRSVTGSSSASSTYPIPESPEHHKQLGDMTVICNEPVWRVEMTEKGDEQYKAWLGKRVDNNENRREYAKKHLGQTGHPNASQLDLENFYPAMMHQASRATETIARRIGQVADSTGFYVEKALKDAILCGLPLSLHNFNDSIMETRHKDAKQGNYIYSGGRTGETGRIDYQRRVLTQQFCHEWASVENREKKGCSYSSDFKVQKLESDDLTKHLHQLFQMRRSSEDSDNGISDHPSQKSKSKLDQMTQNFLQAAKTHFQSSSVVEVTVETAKEFASTAHHGTVNNLTHLNSVTSSFQTLNIKRSDPRVTHELFTLKFNSSKPQQPGTFVIEHQAQKSAVRRRKTVIPFQNVLGLQVDEIKIILDTSKIPQTFYRTKDESGQNSTTWAEYCEGSSETSVSGEKIRLEIQFHQPTKLLNSLIQPDLHLKMAAKEGIQETYHRRSQEIMEPEAFFPIAKDPTTVRAAQLAVLELLKQPEGSDLTWLIKMFGGIYRQFKAILSQGISHVPVSLVEKEE